MLYLVLHYDGILNPAPRCIVFCLLSLFYDLNADEKLLLSGQ